MRAVQSLTEYWRESVVKVILAQGLLGSMSVGGTLGLRTRARTRKEESGRLWSGRCARRGAQRVGSGGGGGELTAWVGWAGAAEARGGEGGKEGWAVGEGEGARAACQGSWEG